MKEYLNEKGSFPVVIMIAFIMIMSVVALTSLSIAEKENLSYSATKDLENLYKEDAVIEMTIHSIKQFLQTQKIEEAEGHFFLESVDIQQVEDMVNSDLLPKFKLEGFNVYISEAYMPPEVSYFCNGIYEEEELKFVEYECLREPFDVQLKLQIEKNGLLKEYILEFNNLYPAVSETGQEIKIDSGEVEFKLSK